MRNKNIIRVFGKRVDLVKNTIHFKGKSTSIQPRLIQLLRTLHEARGEVVLKETLMQRVWTDAIVTEDSLTKAISKLRKILDPDLDESSIQTINGVGYVLRKPRLGQYLKERRLTIALTTAVLLLLYILLGSGVVEWALAHPSQLTN
ncbi:MAG: winged helix-turn-helix transcriptional regulator [Roseivirga sp.]|nr:winged helix-turn-helix transcriptional regulator [Roseivirga sp.]